MEAFRLFLIYGLESLPEIDPLEQWLIPIVPTNAGRRFVLAAEIEIFQIRLNWMQSVSQRRTHEPAITFGAII